MSSSPNIVRFMHCLVCVQTKPRGQSMAEWAQVEVGLTPNALEVWCRRHGEVVMRLTPEVLAAHLGQMPACGECDDDPPSRRPGEAVARRGDEASSDEPGRERS